MSNTEAIGGYFELELRQYDGLFHDNAAALNSGRNAFVYILISLDVKKVYLPSYICPVMIQPLQKLQIDFDFYSINANLEPDDNLEIGCDDHLLYINYFGLKSAAVKKLALKYNHAIIDNAQAFFNLPYKNASTFYSPRKFFGVPDGGFAYINGNSEVAFAPDKTSYERFRHMLKRIEFETSEGLSDYQSHEKEFDNRPMAGMSRLTKKILLSIDYKRVRKIRNENFKELHGALQKFNQLSYIIDSSSVTGPLAYPFLCDMKHLRKHLHKNMIFTPMYWPRISELGQDLTDFESYLIEHLIPLPIDQRYDRRDMHRIIDVIEEFHGHYSANKYA
jgi:hypothetical protein